MAESALAHNQKMDEAFAEIERRNAGSDSTARMVGMIFGLVCFLFLVACALYSSVHGGGWQAVGAFLAVGVISVVPHFLKVHQKQSLKKEDSN
jgi:hypothetical protein